MSLIARYIFNGNLNSTTGTNNLSSLGVAPEYHDPPDGYFLEGKVAHTTGTSNQGAYCTSVAAFNNWTTGTISVWLKADSTTDAYRFFMSHDYFSASRAWQWFNGKNFLYFINNSNHPVLSWTSAYDNIYDHLTHFVMRKTATSIDLWIDGVQVNSVAYSYAFKGATSGRIQLWWFPLDTSNMWKGDTADLRFYSEALSDAEIKKLYTDVKPDSALLISASAGSGGTISPNGNISVNYGTSQSFTISANVGYQISSIKVDNISQTISNRHTQNYTFSNVTTNHTIIASFTTSPTITVTTGVNGSINIINQSDFSWMTTTPTAWYLFNNNANDEKGNYNGTATDVTYESLPSGTNFGGKVAVFNGTSSKIDLPNITLISGTNAKSYEFWQYTTDGSDGSWRVTFGHGETSATNKFSGAWLCSSDNRPAFDTYGANAYYDYTPTPKASWHHHVYTIPAGGTLNDAKYYLDGVEMTISGGSNRSYTVNPPDSNYAIGYRAYNRGNYLNAKVANLRVYNTVLSASEIYNHFAHERTSGNVITYGGSRAYQVEANTNYKIENIQVNSSSVAITNPREQLYTFTNVTTNQTIAATFGQYALTINKTGNGQVSPSTSTSLPYPDGLTVNITPDDHWFASSVVDSVLGDLTDQAVAAGQVTIDGLTDHTLSVVFAQKPVVKRNTTGSGVISVNGTPASSGDTEVDYGSSPIIVVTPGGNYYIESIAGQTVTDADRYGKTFTLSNVTIDVTVSVVFKINPYIDYSAGPGGRISSDSATSSSGRDYVPYNSNKTYTITADQGAFITSIKIDGSEIGIISPSEQSYSFTQITRNRTIEATFTNKPTVTVTSVNHATVTPSGTIQYEPGETPTYTLQVANTYKLDDVLVNGVSVYDQADRRSFSYTFPALQAGTTYTLTPVVSSQYQILSLVQRDGYYYRPTDAKGIITPSGVSYFDDYESQTYTITPAINYRIQAVFTGATFLQSGSDYRLTSTYTPLPLSDYYSYTHSFENITTNNTIAAIFQEEPILTTSINLGTITPSSGHLTFQANQTFNISIPAHTYIESIYVNGTKQENPSTTFELKRIAGDINIVVNVKHYPYLVNLNKSVNGIPVYKHCKTLTYDTEFKFSSDPANRIALLELTQDQIGGHSVTFLDNMECLGTTTYQEIDQQPNHVSTITVIKEDNHFGYFVTVN